MMTQKNSFLFAISSVVSLALLLAALAQPNTALAQNAAEKPLTAGTYSNLPQAMSAQEPGQRSRAADLAAVEVVSQVVQVENCTQWHDIVRGETLHKIGLKYGLSWRALADLNQLANPNLIYAGSKLCIRSQGGASPTPTPTPAGTPTVKIPTFKIDAVTRDQSVTITTANFPANDSFEVLMGAFGTRGVKGTKVDTVSSGQGGSFTATFSIPASMKGSRLIAIRLQSPTSGYYSYNWFHNTTQN